jgi:hypothetical protein
LPKLENSSDFDENWCTTVIFDVDHEKKKQKKKNKEKIPQEKADFPGRPLNSYHYAKMNYKFLPILGGSLYTLLLMCMLIIGKCCKKKS